MIEPTEPKKYGVTCILGRHKSREFMISFVSWMPARDALPDDIAALKAALIVERAQGSGGRGGAGGRPRQGVGRHGADRPAEAADRQTGAPGLRATIGALGAADRSIGARVRRAGSRRHGRRTGGGDSGRQDDDGRRIYAQAPRAQHVPRSSSPRARGDRSADGMRMLRRQSPAQARRGRDPDAGNAASPVEGDRDGAGEVHLPRLREDHASAGAVPCHREGMGGPEPAGDDRVREVRSASALEPPGRALRSGRRADRAVDHGRRRGLGLRGARSAPSPYRSPRHGGRAPAWGRYDRAGSGRRKDRHRAMLDLCARRQAVRRRRAAGGDVLLLARSQGRASAGASGGICRHPASRRL